MLEIFEHIILFFFTSYFYCMVWKVEKCCGAIKKFMKKKK